MNDDFQDHIEKAIREAREKGAFNDLRGKGKPIQWDDDSLVPDDQRLANKILKDAGFVPDWIAEWQEIEKEYTEARRALRLAKAARDERRLDAAGWMAAQYRFTEAVTALNRRIQRYNLRLPAAQLQRPLFAAQPPNEP